MSKTIEELLTLSYQEGTETPVTGCSPMTGLNPSIQKHIGNLLKASFQDVVNEPVPERFSQLLEQLEQAEQGKPKTNKGS